MINYVKGDLFKVIDDDFEGMTYIPHIVNTHGLWGSGFVIPVERYCPSAKKEYLSVFNYDYNTPVPDDSLLGDNDYIRTRDNKSCIVNMFAQTFGVERPIRYDKLVSCMEDIVRCIEIFPEDQKSRIVAPKFGSLRAGGNWDFIEKLIEDIWTTAGISVTIVTYDEQKQHATVRRVNGICEKCSDS